VEATQRCLQARPDPLLSVDELRRCMEEFSPELYHRLTQYERWALSLTNLLIEKGILDKDEISSRVELLRARNAAAT
jgi:hypothetical protein